MLYYKNFKTDFRYLANNRTSHNRKICELYQNLESDQYDRNEKTVCQLPIVLFNSREYSQNNDFGNKITPPENTSAPLCLRALDDGLSVEETPRRHLPACRNLSGGVTAWKAMDGIG